jgi:glutamyl-tRNA reductase
MGIVVIGLSHRSSPVAVRERFAFSEARVPSALALLKDSGEVDEAVILSTCNRVEIYAATRQVPSRAFEALQHFLVKCHDYRDPLTDEVYAYAEPQSLEHLFRVAAGLDSMVLGETEILGQLKQAYQVALEGGFTGPRLNKAFQRAFNVAKQIRTETCIQKGAVSVASVAVELAEKVFETLSHRVVLVIGAGDTSEKTARALLSRGAERIVVTNRSYEKAAALAGQLGGTALPFESWDREFANIDIIISSTSSPHYVLEAGRLEPLMRSRLDRPLVLIDIAVPRDIDPQANYLESVYLYNIDDLQAIAEDYLQQRQAEVAVCEGIIRERAQGLLDRQPRPEDRGTSVAPGPHSSVPAQTGSLASPSTP